MQSDTVDKVFSFLEDHYWDSLDDNIVRLHLRSCKEKLMTEDIDWERLAKGFQIENEVLRRQVDGLSSRNMPQVNVSLGPVLKDMVTWIEAHPFAIIAICYVLSTLLMDAVDISMKVRNAA